MNTFIEANQQLTGRNHDSRKVANKTYMQRRGEDIAIQLHGTDVVTFRPDGATVLNTGGRQTVTTKERINRYLPAGWGLWQDKSIWYLGKWDNGHDPAVFADGITILADGTIQGEGPPVKDLRALHRDIKTYVDGFIDAIEQGEARTPDAGDCWYCLMQFGRDAEHIRSHIEEGYYVGSLLRNAIEELPVSQAAHWYLQGEDTFQDLAAPRVRIAIQQLRSSLRRYIRNALGLAR